MSSVVVKSGFNQETFQAFLAAKNEPQWLRELRERSWKTFQQLSWPARNDEEWIHTDIRLFKLDQFGLPVDAAGASPLTKASVTPLLSEGVDLGGHVASLDSRPGSSQL